METEKSVWTGKGGGMIPAATGGESPFVVRRANEWLAEAKERPAPRMLFGEFWLEGELAIMFADTGQGKSILAVQIAESLAAGRSIEPLRCTAAAQKVLYFDFELTDKQFEMRYARTGEAEDEFLAGHYQFSENLYRAQMRMDGTHPPEFRSHEEYVLAWLERVVREVGAGIVIIDNITFLRSRQEQSMEAAALMRGLKKLKEDLRLSVLVLAHTPKRALRRPITVNDLHGSKTLSNFADNIFAIGRSGKDLALRYVKHIKPRSTEMVYDDAYVPSFEIGKRDGNFLAFEFREWGEEWGHLATAADEVRQQRSDVVKRMAARGMSQREIARELRVSPASVNRYMNLPSPFDDEQKMLERDRLAAAAERERWQRAEEERLQRLREELAAPDEVFEDDDETDDYDEADEADEEMLEIAEKIGVAVELLRENLETTAAYRERHPADDLGELARLTRIREHHVKQLKELEAELDELEEFWAPMENRPLGLEALRRDWPAELAGPEGDDAAQSGKEAPPERTEEETQEPNPMAGLRHTLDGNGKEIWIEEDGPDDRPSVWYSYDSAGRRCRHNRDAFGITTTRLNPPQMRPGHQPPTGSGSQTVRYRSMGF